MFELLQIVVFLLILFSTAVPLGNYLGIVLSEGAHSVKKPFQWIEYGIYQLCGINPREEMGWKEYTKALLVFNFLGFLLLLFLQLFQEKLPLNTEHFANVPFWLSVNTAISFVTNTNWQAYTGESTLGYLTQMLGLGVQNFLSAATGIAVALCLARGLSRQSTTKIGSFWVDMIRPIVYILLPASFLFAFFLISQGVIQNFAHYMELQTLEGAKQILPMGPAASQIAIKQLGSNGGGFFGANSAHPFENPTSLSNFFEIFAIMAIPCALPIAFGRLVGNKKHGNALFYAMAVLFLISLGLGLWAEFAKNPQLQNISFLEGKEFRFGIGSSLLWAITTTVTSNGSVNAMLSSYSPLAGGLAMVNMMLGEVIFGGVGSGLYGMALFVILAVFIAGLMVGRTPEYLGKKIEAGEIKLAVVAVLVPSATILIFSAISLLIEPGISSLAHTGPHGLSEILYAFTSGAANNGSAFGGLNANTNYYNIMMSIAMLVGRFSIIIPVLAISGQLAAKKLTPPSQGTFPTEGPIFITLLCFTVLIVGALTFFPALCLGPLMEHFLMLTTNS